jgi:hypothetical protein
LSVRSKQPVVVIAGQKLLSMFALCFLTSE